MIWWRLGREVCNEIPDISCSHLRSHTSRHRNPWWWATKTPAIWMERWFPGCFKFVVQIVLVQRSIWWKSYRRPGKLSGFLTYSTFCQMYETEFCSIWQFCNRKVCKIPWKFQIVSCLVWERMVTGVTGLKIENTLNHLPWHFSHEKSECGRNRQRRGC